jgi:hypothetical protein
MNTILIGIFVLCNFKKLSFFVIVNLWRRMETVWRDIFIVSAILEWIGMLVLSTLTIPFRLCVYLFLRECFIAFIFIFFVDATQRYCFYIVVAPSLRWSQQGGAIYRFVFFTFRTTTAEIVVIEEHVFINCI